VELPGCLVILGGGTGGTIAAWTFAGQGKRVAVIERKIAQPENIALAATFVGSGRSMHNGTGRIQRRSNDASVTR